MKAISRILVTLMMLSACLAGSAAAEQSLSLALEQDDFDVLRFPSDGEYLVLWLAPEYGFREAHRELARRLPDRGIEVWQVDLADSLFLPPGSTTLRSLDGTLVARLMAAARRESGKKIALAGDSYASLAALSGARSWQKLPRETDYFIGAILFSPYTFAAIPPLGEAPEYMPIVDATNIPLLVFQAEGSAVSYRFGEMLERLRGNGSPVYTRMLPGVMSLFYEEPPDEPMRRAAEPIPAIIDQMLPLLARHEVPRQQVAMRARSRTSSGIDLYLRPFTAPMSPRALELDDIDGNRVSRAEFTGKVTLVNFWATWCPPCVEEIPSLNRLQQKMKGRPFELISINYAEPRERVAAFLDRVEVEYPVLLDHDGDYARAWNVITYPSTFVIDYRGRIRFGVNAAIDWDDPELIATLEALMDQPEGCGEAEAC